MTEEQEQEIKDYLCEGKALGGVRPLTGTQRQALQLVYNEMKRYRTLWEQAELA